MVGNIGPRILRYSTRWPWGHCCMPSRFVSPVPIGGPRSRYGRCAETERPLPLQCIEFGFLCCKVCRRVSIVTEKARRLLKFLTYFPSFVQNKRTIRSPLSSPEKFSSTAIASPSIRAFENSVRMLCDWVVECSSIHSESWWPYPVGCIINTSTRVNSK